MPDEFENEDFDNEELNEPPPFFPKDLGRGGFLGSPILVRIEGMYGTETAGTVQRFVQLQDDDGRVLPISIGPFEAMAISLALEGAQLDRPMTHDLMRVLVERLDGVLDRVVIDDLWNSTYYAKLYIRKGDEELEIDSRPSDAIALAVRFNAPIYVIDSILDSVHGEEA